VIAKGIFKRIRINNAAHALDVIRFDSGRQTQNRMPLKGRTHDFAPYRCIHIVMTLIGNEKTLESAVTAWIPTMIKARLGFTESGLDRHDIGQRGHVKMVVMATSYPANNATWEMFFQLRIPLL